MLLSYLAYYVVNNIDEFLRLGNITFHQLIQMYIISCLTIIVISTRMLLLLREYGLSKISYIEWTRIYILARFFNKVVPQAGNIYRAFKLKQDYNFSYSKYLTTFVVFILLDVVIILLISTIVLFIFESSLLVRGIPVFIVPLSAFVFIISVPIFISLIAKIKINESSRLFKIFREYNAIISALSSHHLIINQITLSMSSFVLYIYLFYICSISISVDIPISMLIIFSAIIKLSTYIVITPGNIGIKEMALGYLSTTINLDFGVGIMISGISNVIIYIATITMGCFFGGIPMIKGLHNLKANSYSEKNLS